MHAWTRRAYLHAWTLDAWTPRACAGRLQRMKSAEDITRRGASGRGGYDA